METHTILLAIYIELDKELDDELGKEAHGGVPRGKLEERFTQRAMTREDFDITLAAALHEGDLIEPEPGRLELTPAGLEKYRRDVKPV